MDLDRATMIGLDLIEEHLPAFVYDNRWSFKFDKAKRRAGCCNYSKRTISLSRHFVELNSEDEVRLTILHEIAHALTPGHHHDAVWKAKCAELGGATSRCYDTAGNGRSVVMAEGKWRAVCPNCKQVFHRHRKLKDDRHRWCKACGPSLGTLTYRQKGE